MGLSSHENMWWKYLSFYSDKNKLSEDVLVKLDSVHHMKKKKKHKHKHESADIEAKPEKTVEPEPPAEPEKTVEPEPPAESATVEEWVMLFIVQKFSFSDQWTTIDQSVPFIKSHLH